MSRIGKAPIKLPEGVVVHEDGKTVVVEGPKGKLEMPLFRGLVLSVEKDNLKVVPDFSDREFKSQFWGLQRSLLANMVQGVYEGFRKVLEIRGVGYRAKVDGNVLQLNLGYSNMINYEIPEDVKIEVDKQNRIIISGIDKQKVGEVAAQIRSYRKPDVYKGKGIRYEGEWVRHKVGKAGGK